MAIPRSRALLTLAAFTSALATGHTAHAETIDPNLGDVAPFLTLFPEAKTAPAGSGLVPGVRVTYQSAAAAAAGGASGAGVIQYDIVEVDGAQVVAFQHSYADGGAGIYPITTGYAAGYPGIGGFWINPAVLQRAEAVAGAQLSVTRVPRTLGNGQTINVVRFESTSSGRSVWEFDVNTGVLAFDSIASGGSAAQLTLFSVRTITLPWAVDRAPNWVRPGADIRYTGALSTTIPAAGTVQQPATSQIQITHAGAHWSLSSTTTTVMGASQGAAPGVTGSGQVVGAAWLPRSALTANLSAAPTLFDTDPATGATMTVARSADGKITLEQVTSASRTTTDYDGKLGVLDHLRQSIQLQTALKQSDVQRGAGGSDLAALAAQPELPDDPTPQAAGTAGGANGGGGGCNAAGSLASSSLSAVSLVLIALGLRKKLFVA